MIPSPVILLCRWISIHSFWKKKLRTRAKNLYSSSRVKWTWWALHFYPEVITHFFPELLQQLYCKWHHGLSLSSLRTLLTSYCHDGSIGKQSLQELNRLFRGVKAVLPGLDGNIKKQLGSLISCPCPCLPSGCLSSLLGLSLRPLPDIATQSWSWSLQKNMMKKLFINFPSSGILLQWTADKDSWPHRSLTSGDDKRLHKQEQNMVPNCKKFRIIPLQTLKNSLILSLVL